MRRATEQDLLALAELERDANIAGLSHVFPPERFPFPFDAALARWRIVLDDPDAVVLVADAVEPVGRLDVYVAYDAEWVRHVAVHPDRWGEGLASEAIDLAVADMVAGGSTTAHLWVLEENHRARRLYEHLGWTVTDRRRQAPWPPYPMEVGYRRELRG